MVACCFCLLSCGGGLSAEQQAKLDAAVAALERAKAATDVGVRHDQYTSLIVEAQAAVTEAELALPDGELVGALSGVMEAHADAKSVWDWTLTHVALRTGRDPGTKVIPEYSVPAEPRVDSEGEEYLVADQKLALQMIWAEAAARHAELRSMLDGE